MGGPRPDGVMALSVVEALGGLGTAVIGAYLLSSLNAVAAAVGLGAANLPDLYAFFSVEVAAGALALVAAYGLWGLRGWGWSLALYLGAAFLVFAIGIGAYSLATFGDAVETEAGLLPMAVSLVAVYYLDKPATRRLFRK